MTSNTRQRYALYTPRVKNNTSFDLVCPHKWIFFGIIFISTDVNSENFVGLGISQSGSTDADFLNSQTLQPVSRKKNKYLPNKTHRTMNWGLDENYTVQVGRPCLYSYPITEYTRPCCYRSEHRSKSFCFFVFMFFCFFLLIPNAI